MKIIIILGILNCESFNNQGSALSFLNNIFHLVLIKPLNSTLCMDCCKHTFQFSHPLAVCEVYGSPLHLMIYMDSTH